MKKNNPFPIYKYVNSKFFCNRTQETERIISAVTNHRNICVFSEDGFGKTMLIKHVEAELKELENYRFFYLGLKKTENLNDFLNVILETISTKADFEEVIKKYFAEIKFKIENIKQKKQIQISENEAEVNFEKILSNIQNYLATKNNKTVLAFDDIQNVLKYLNNNQRKELHNFIVFSENISFIISTNNPKTLDILLQEELEKTEKIELLKIDKEKYSKFIQKRFTKENRKIDRETIEYILRWSKATTFYTHYLCNKIFEAGYKNITKKSVKKVIKNILTEYDFVFESYRKLLSEYQWQLLTAIAKESNVFKITSTDFINKYNLNAPSSVKTAVNALIDKELVIRTKNSYHIKNTLFERWLNRY